MHFIHITIRRDGPAAIEIAFGGGEAAHDVCVGLQPVLKGDGLARLYKGGEIIGKEFVDAWVNVIGVYA